MEANELRIGNLVMIDGSIIKTSSGVIYNCVRNENCYKPIPLTEEWLLKFGFDKDECESTYYNSSYYNISLISSGLYHVYLDTSDPRLKGAIPIKYVHQLQNLYFALTNEELLLK